MNPVFPEPADPVLPRHTVLRWGILVCCALSVIALDQTAKMLVTRALAPGDFVIPVPFLSDVFAITLSYNTGAAFGLLPQAGDLFLMLAVVLVMGTLLFYRKMPAGHWPERLALGLVIGGAVGNAIDRLRFGYVIDFVNLRIPGVLSNVSNFADHAILLGVAILIVRQWLADRSVATSELASPPEMPPDPS